MNRKIKTILFLIIIMASLLRLVGLGSNPSHLTQDEAALGYNAYSILKTGKDEYGQTLPLIFKSFGDYKPGLYIYIATPSILVFGLNEFAVRLPSALAGILAVYLVYKIVSLAAYKDNNSRKEITLGLLAAFILAINPWHVHLSRGAWEVNLSLTFVLIGVLMFFMSLKKSKLLILSSLFFGLTLLTYQGAKLSTLIVIICLVIAYRDQIKLLFKKDSKSIYLSVVALLVLSLPIVFSFFKGQTGRLAVFSVLSHPRQSDYLYGILDQAEVEVGSSTYYIYYSEGLNFARGIMGRWFNHFSARYLFFNGDWQNPRHTVPGVGVMLFADLVLVLFGLYAVIRKRTSFTIFILLWLILAPLPAILSRDQVQAIRSANMIIPLVLVAAFGAQLVLSGLKKGKLIKLGVWLFLLIYVASIIYFLDALIVHNPKHNAKYWNYGYREVVNAITPIQNNYDLIVLQQSYNQPYIYFLFYQKYDPGKYQMKAKLKESEYGDVGFVTSLDNIEFKPFSWPAVERKGTLIAGDAISIPSEIDRNIYELKEEIHYPNGIDTAMRIVEVK